MFADAGLTQPLGNILTCLLAAHAVYDDVAALWQPARTKYP